MQFVLQIHTAIQTSYKHKQGCKVLSHYTDWCQKVHMNLIVLFSHRNGIVKHIFSHSILHKSSVQPDITRLCESNLGSTIGCCQQSRLMTGHQSILAHRRTDPPVSIRALWKRPNVSSRGVTDDLVLARRFEDILNFHSLKHLSTRYNSLAVLRSL